MGRDRIIEAYIQRLLAWEKPITRATLTRIAEEVGITSGELEAISIQAKAHFTRGRGYIEFGCLDDAINELNQAAALEPVNLEILQALANVYGLRYNRTRERADKQTALLIAKRCVELKPDAKEAMVLISFLEHTPAKGKQQASKWTQQKITVLAGGLATFSIGLLGVSRLPVFSKPPAPLGPAPGSMIPGSALYEPGQSVEPGGGIEIDFVSDVDIPVIFDHPGLMLEARVSELGDYENEVYYRLQGVFINASDQEFSKLTLNVEFLDRNDLAIATTTKDAVADTDAVIRPGDTHTFNLLQRVTPDLATIRLSVTNLEQSLARNTYVPPTPINYGWETPEPDGISFELTSRSEKAVQDDKSAADSATKPSFNAEWVIINTSELPIRELKLKADFYDNNEQLLQTEDVFVINTNDAALLPGETRPFRIITPIASGYRRYKVSVAEIE
ncbi:MAG: hypothetical protein AAGI69_12040 [Cyanobacteria bacterium P01_H01_bin.21]